MNAEFPRTIDASASLQEPVQGEGSPPAERALSSEPWLQLLATQPEQVQARLLYATLLKPLLDCLVATLMLLVVSPLLLLIALALMVESQGPVLFRQRRVGHYGQPFTVYKFRTMIPDRRRHRSEYSGTERRTTHKTRHDPRVTRLGRLLRATSLDELPQLLNIVRGEMSFIGPRPELPELVERYASWQHARHLVRPGLSGWWQVQGRKQPMHQYTELDVYYVEQLSLGLDVRILLQTVWVVLSKDGAF